VKTLLEQIEGRKTVIRVLRTIGKAAAQINKAAKAGAIILEGRDGRRCVVPAVLLEAMVRRGVLIRRDDHVWATAPGREMAIGCKDAGEGYDDQHRDIEACQIEFAGASHTASVNMAESPLALLARRKDRNGRPFLEKCELLAGERLRADFTRGSLSPKLGVNWQAAAGGGGRSGLRGGIDDLTDAALSARMRVEKAIEAIGPELSGVLLDACCFLKGMETIENERGWPARAAKILLKTALGALARHYGYASSASSSRRPGRIVQWGDDGYRPTLDGRN